MKKTMSLVAAFGATIALGQNVGINTDGSTPTELLHVKTTTADAAGGILIENPNAGNGDAIITFQNNGSTNEWTLGFDDSDADQFKISQSGAVGTTDGFIIDSDLQLLAGDDGSAAAPVWSFDSDTDLGFYRAGANQMRFVTQGADRVTVRADGEVVVGATTTVIADDLFSSVGNATLDWAVNGYTGFDAGGVYGQVTGGTTAFAAVQGEYVGTGQTGPGVRGATYTTTAGTNFDGSTVAGIDGVLLTGNLTRSFGVMGQTGNNINRRTGGVLGTDYWARGALGYYAQNFADYAVYGFGTAYQAGLATGMAPGVGTLKSSTTGSDLVNMENNSMIGIGIYGGVMGGWVKGLVYGTNLSGDRYAVYSHGKSITNEAYVVLNNVGASDRIATYATTSTSVDVSEKGKGQLANGELFVAFSPEFAAMVESGEAIITVTPLGESNGLFISNIGESGFTVKESNGGTSNVSFNWIAIGQRKGGQDFAVSPEILDRQFEERMYGVMINEDNESHPEGYLWYDGNNVRFDQPPAKVLPQEILERTLNQARHQPGK